MEEAQCYLAQTAFLHGKQCDKFFNIIHSKKSFCAYLATQLSFNLPLASMLFMDVSYQLVMSVSFWC